MIVCYFKFNIRYIFYTAKQGSNCMYGCEFNAFPCFAGASNNNHDKTTIDACDVLLILYSSSR